MQTHHHGFEPFSLQRRNLKGGTKPLEGWGFRNEIDALTDVLLGSPAYLRHLSTSSLSCKHLCEAPCNIQVGQAQHAELVSAYERFGVKVHMNSPTVELPMQVYARDVGSCIVFMDDARVVIDGPSRSTAQSTSSWAVSDAATYSAVARSSSVPGVRKPNLYDPID